LASFVVHRRAEADFDGLCLCVLEQTAVEMASNSSVTAHDVQVVLVLCMHHHQHGYNCGDRPPSPRRGDTPGLSPETELQIAIDCDMN